MLSFHRVLTRTRRSSSSTCINRIVCGFYRIGSTGNKSPTMITCRSLYDIPNPKKSNKNGPSGKPEVFDARAAYDERMYIKEMEDEYKLIAQKQKEREELQQLKLQKENDFNK